LGGAYTWTQGILFRCLVCLFMDGSVACHKIIQRMHVESADAPAEYWSKTTTVLPSYACLERPYFPSSNNTVNNIVVFANTMILKALRCFDRPFKTIIHKTLVLAIPRT
jgi:hypothetical protein